MVTEVYNISGLCQGQFSIMPHPKGADELTADVNHWLALGINVVVSLLTEEEQVELKLMEESRLCRANNILYVNFPIRDEVPDSVESVLSFIEQVKSKTSSSDQFLFHCRGGVGRSAMILSLVAVGLGEDIGYCFKEITRSRGEVAPETEMQKQWLRNICMLPAFSVTSRP